MLAGEHINTSEDRAVLHTALRLPREATLTVDRTEARLLRPDLAVAVAHWSLTGSRSREDEPLRKRLKEIFSHEQAPTPLHEFLAGLPAPLLIVTTNYDDLL